MTVLKHWEVYSSACVFAEFALVSGGSSPSSADLIWVGMEPHPHLLGPPPFSLVTASTPLEADWCSPQGEGQERKEGWRRRLRTSLFLLREVTRTSRNLA